MIDLHVHTTYSDGTWTLKETLKNAQIKGVDTLSITDHNSVGAYYEMDTINVKDYFKGRIIKGVEIDATFDGMKVELLGYNFDRDKLNRWLEENANIKVSEEKYIEEYYRLAELCAKAGIRIDNIDYTFSIGYPSSVIYKNIKKYPENEKYFDKEVWNNRDVFFRNFTTNKKFPLYINMDESAPYAADVSKAIRDAGGKVFLAHLFVYAMEDHMSFFDDLDKENILDGVEAYYSYYTESETQMILEHASLKGLLISCGTDCHGDKHSEIKIGTGLSDMNIKSTIIDDWGI